MSNPIAIRALNRENTKRQNYETGSALQIVDDHYTVQNVVAGGVQVTQQERDSELIKQVFLSDEELANAETAGTLVHHGRQRTSVDLIDEAYSQLGIYRLDQLTNDQLQEIWKRHSALDLIEQFRLERGLRKPKSLADFEMFREEIVDDFQELSKARYLAASGTNRTVESRKAYKNLDDVVARADTTLVYDSCPSAQRLKRWQERLDALDGDLVALAARYKNGGRPKIKLSRAKKEVLWTAALFFCRREGGNYNKALAEAVSLFESVEFNHRIDPLEKLPTMHQLKSLLDIIPEIDRYAMSHGVKRTLQRYGRNGIVPLATMRGQRVEMDEWCVHFHSFVDDIGLSKFLSPKLRGKIRRKPDTERITISVAIDAASKTILGMRFGRTANTNLALATLHDAFVDKTQRAMAVGCKKPWHYKTGITELYTDNGPAYISDRFVLATSRTLKQKTLLPKGKPYMRGLVERVFRTFELCMTGYIGGATKAHPFADREYASAIYACATTDELMDLMVRVVVDVYHHTPHLGLGGLTPDEKWIELGELGNAVLPDDRKRIVAFGAETVRQLSGQGLQVAWVNYNSRRLQEWFRQCGGVEISICIDPDNMRKAWANFAGDWHELRATNCDEFDGVAHEDYLEALRCINTVNRIKNELRRDVREATRSISDLTGRFRERNRLTSREAATDVIKEVEKNLSFSHLFDPNLVGDEPKPLFDDSNSFSVVNSTDGSGENLALGAAVQMHQAFSQPDEAPKVPNPEDREIESVAYRLAAEPMETAEIVAHDDDYDEYNLFEVDEGKI